ncbi:hypothetical protein HDU96_001092, partial [Phlyctochytrium bullatum]
IFAIHNMARVNDVVLLAFTSRNHAPPAHPADINTSVGLGADRRAPAEVGLDAYADLQCGWVFGLSQVRTPILGVQAVDVRGRQVWVPACLVPNRIAQEQFTQVVLFAVNKDVDVALDSPGNVVAGPVTINVDINA